MQSSITKDQVRGHELCSSPLLVSVSSQLRHTAPIAPANPAGWGRTSSRVTSRHFAGPALAPAQEKRPFARADILGLAVYFLHFLKKYLVEWLHLNQKNAIFCMK